MLPQDDLFLRVYFKSCFLILASHNFIISKNLVILIYKSYIGSSHNQAHRHTYRLIDTESNRFTYIPTKYSSERNRQLESETWNVNLCKLQFLTYKMDTIKHALYVKRLAYELKRIIYFKTQC